MFQCKVYQHSSFRQVPNCWPGSGMQSELGTDYSRPLDIGHSTRLPTRAGVHTSTAISTPRVAFESSGVPFNREGNREADTEGSSIPSRPGARPVHQSDICGSQKGRKVSTSCEPKGSEQAHEAPPLQNGRCPSAERSPPERGLDGIHRSKGCISIGVSGTALQTSPAVHVGRTAFSVSVPSIRAFHCPSSVHQGDETSGVFTATTWNPGHNIYRRYISDGSETGRPAGHDQGDYHPVAPTGVQHKLGQICTNTISRDSISGLCGELRGHDYVTAGGEGQEHSDGMSGDPKARESHGQRTIQGAWKDDSSITGSPPSSPVLSQSPASKELGICQSPVLRGSDSSRHTRTGGAAVVVQIHEELERESDPGTKATDDNRVRCLPARLGGSVWQRYYRGPVVTRGTIHAHKLSGAPGGFLGGENICQRQGEPEHSTPDGQYDSNLICESNGGDPLIQPLCNSRKSVAMVFTKKDNVVSRAPSGDPKYMGGCRVSYSPLISRMEAAGEHLSSCLGLAGAMSGRSICNLPKPSTSTVCELEARPSCSGDRCFRDEMGGLSGVCLSSLFPSGQVPTQGDTRGVHNCTNSTCVASPSMVPDPAEVPGGVPSVATQTSSVANGPLQQVTPSLTEGTATACCVESIRQRHSAEGISSRASKLILAGWSKATNSAYQSSWQRWNRWCAGRGIDPFSCHVREFLDFLADLYEEGLEHRTVNSIRSAVSMTHCHVEGVPIGQHPLVIRLLKGVYNSRPPRPRYSATWDVDSVIQYLASLEEDNVLSLRTLSQKIALLMSLVEASRTSELQALDLRFRVFKPEGVIFRLPSLTKKRITGAPPKELFFASFPSNPKICPVSCLRSYEKRTVQFRQMDQSVAQPLFISYIKPHKPVTSQRIAHWIKDLLGQAGVDTSVFKAHSVRGAAATAALNKGVTLADILQAADWSSDTTFRRFYYRPTSSTSFGRGILDMRK